MLDCWEQQGRDRPDFEQLVMRINTLQDNMVGKYPFHTFNYPAGIGRQNNVDTTSF